MNTNLAEDHRAKERQNRLSEGCKRKTVGDQEYRHRIRAESQSHLNKPNDYQIEIALSHGMAERHLEREPKLTLDVLLTAASSPELMRLFGEDVESHQVISVFSPTSTQSEHSKF